MDTSIKQLVEQARTEAAPEEDATEETKSKGDLLDSLFEEDYCPKFNDLKGIFFQF